MDCARSGVAVIEEMIRSILPVFRAGIRPSKGIFSMSHLAVEELAQRLGQVHADAGRLALGINHLERRIIQFHADDERCFGCEGAQPGFWQQQAERQEGEELPAVIDLAHQSVQKRRHSSVFHATSSSSRAIFNWQGPARATCAQWAME